MSLALASFKQVDLNSAQGAAYSSERLDFSTNEVMWHDSFSDAILNSELAFLREQLHSTKLWKPGLQVNRTLYGCPSAGIHGAEVIHDQQLHNRIELSQPGKPF
ncbi:LOW QUALITY PROTEIN: hypothetical protein IFM46972_05927 [Aspergillus udagawae]|uniref:Uncharacterized protein n=1 Tax=Aspergillus udagawae TaxID=91492 RepID=A0A8H3NWD9_9EURO|nr:LOW QUALITY PROTEIN: hypothetical protein IFM46972_05927 [Aspergillus udagawae]